MPRQGNIEPDELDETLATPLTPHGFWYDGKRYCSVHGLVALLPRRASPQYIHYYELNAKLIDFITYFGKFQQADITSERYHICVRQARNMLIYLLEEESRVQEQLKSLWFYERTSLRYLKAWLNLVQELKRHAERYQNRIEIFTEVRMSIEPLPLTIELSESITKTYNQQSIRTPVEMIPYLPSTTLPWWKRWFDFSGRINFLQQKQNLLQPVHVDFKSPREDLIQLDAAYLALQHERTNVEALLTATPFYRILTKFFYRAWLKILDQAEVRLERGKDLWEIGLELIQERKLGALKREVEQTCALLSLANPDEYEYCTDEQITKAEESLNQMLTALGQKESRFAELIQEGYSIPETEQGKFNQTLQSYCAKITAYQQGFADLKWLALQKAQLGTLPSETAELPEIDINNLAKDAYIQLLRILEANAHEAKAKLATALTASNTGFGLAKYLRQWGVYIDSFLHNNIKQQKHVLMCLMKSVYDQGYIIENAGEQFIACANHLLADKNIKELSGQDIEDLNLIKRDIGSLPNRKIDYDDNFQKLKQATLPKIKRSLEILDELATEERYFDTRTMQWLCRLYNQICSEQEIDNISSRRFYQEQLDVLNAALAPVLLLADSICDQHLICSTANQTMIDSSFYVEILCFGILLQLGNEDIKTRQANRLRTYLLQQLKTITQTDSSLADHAESLTTFEGLIKQLGSIAFISEIEALEQLRQKQDWNGYKVCCQHWLNLLTQTPVACLDGIGLFNQEVVIQPTTATIPTPQATAE